MEPVKSTKILVVEDDADDSFMLVRQLEKAQIDDHVMVIENGQKALTFLQAAAELPLCIFLDLRLPGLSGIELLEKVKSDPRLQAIPVIVMTGSSNPHDVAECEHLGAASFQPFRSFDHTTVMPTPRP
jgi:CheY-like chemotaxis protein